MMSRPILPVAIGLSILSLIPVAQATPRLAAQYGQDCQLCHANPSGGGLRNSYVTDFIGPAELPLRPLPAHESARWPKARLNDFVTVGTDLRLLYLASDNARTAVGELDNSFFQMQADFYVAIEPDPQFLLYLDRGTGSDYEVFALARLLPAHGYVKGGRFVPDLGWRWDDHNRYTRERLDLDYPGATETGIEVGLSPGPLTLTGGVFNGNGNAQLDDNSQKMYVGKALARWRMGTVQAAFGGSTRWNSGPQVKERLWGIQGQASWRQFAYLADLFGRRTASDADSGRRGRTWSWVMSQELDFRPRQGLDLYVGYDFLDPDLDHENGTQYRISVGSRIYLRHFFKVEPLVRFERETTPRSVTDDARVEILFHAFY
jgi:hypothetical protein